MFEAYKLFANTAKAAADKHEDTHIKNIIPVIEIDDVKKRETALRNSKFKKDFLVDAVLFLQNTFPAKNPMNTELVKLLKIQELITLLLKIVSAASPSHCRDCNSVYNGQTKSNLHCFLCGMGLCSNCVTKEALDRGTVRA